MGMSSKFVSVKSGAGEFSFSFVMIGLSGCGYFRSGYGNGASEIAPCVKSM